MWCIITYFLCTGRMSLASKWFYMSARLVMCWVLGPVTKPLKMESVDVRMNRWVAVAIVKYDSIQSEILQETRPVDCGVLTFFRTMKISLQGFSLLSTKSAKETPFKILFIYSLRSTVAILLSSCARIIRRRSYDGLIQVLIGKAKNTESLAARVSG